MRNPDAEDTAINDRGRSMNTANNAAASHPLRPFYWSLRREIWEHRSIYMAPLIVAAVVLVGLLIASAQLPGTLRSLPTMSVARQHDLMSMPYSIAAVLLLITSIAVGCLYCLDAMHGERRDRSILFWKSLPVSDATTVLAKASVPLVLLPLLTFVIGTAVHIVLLLVSSVITLASGFELATLWSQLPLIRMPLGFSWFLIAMALWYAPLYAWLLFISAWAKRGTFIWAIVPPLALLALEVTTLKTSVFMTLMKARVAGGLERAFSATPKSAAALEPGTSADGIFPDPTKFLTNPELWIGLAIAALLIYATIHLRRRREPI